MLYSCSISWWGWSRIGVHLMQCLARLCRGAASKIVPEEDMAAVQSKQQSQLQLLLVSSFARPAAMVYYSSLATMSALLW
jgi:hypothetical protein